MRGLILLCLLAYLPLPAQVAPIPAPTQLPGSPFFIKKNWIIGGTGNWDYLAIDPAAQRLYIAHGHIVQVVDIQSGSIAGEIGGFREAHAIALDADGKYGYVSDGPANAVAVFNRSTPKVEATIPIPCSPRSIAYEPRSELVFAVCPAVAGPSARPQPGRGSSGGSSQPAQAPGSANRENIAGISHLVVIDAEERSAIADVAISGVAGFAQADEAGAVYVAVAGAAARFETRNGSLRRIVANPRIAKFDGSALAAEAGRGRQADTALPHDAPVAMDWTEDDGSGSEGHYASIPSPCAQPQGLAVDARDSRLFVACNGQQLVVLDAGDGRLVSTLTTGPGGDAVGYDPDRELIYSANGSGYGSLTIVQQDANTDTYAVIQNLPTLAHARTLAVDSSTGNVYIATEYTGVDLTPRGGFGAIKTAPVAGSFQVLVIGH